MRVVSRLLAMLALGLCAILVVLGMTAPWSRSGWFAIACLAIAGVGLAIREPKPKRVLLLIAALLVLSMVTVRLIAANEGMVSMRTLPRNEPSRWLARILDEQDIVQLKVRLQAHPFEDPDSGASGLGPALHAAYVDMHREQPYAPSPVPDTLIGLQTPQAFDTLIIEPRAQPKPGVPVKFGVIVLHGSEGSTTLACWLVATAARGVGAVTVCPARSFDGHWADEAGERILHASLDYLHARGIRRIFLAGLSSGGTGARDLASRFPQSFEGLILISGTPASGDAALLPTLVVHGLRDASAPVEAARAFASRVHATWAGVDGGHFVLLMRRAEVRAAILDWLMARTGYHATY
jgi:pimeloyl-ACP methyl ester carboxylesterase